MVSELIRPAASDITGLFEDILNRGLSLRVKVTGRSMAPFLKGGEVLTIQKTALSSLRKGDLLFFRDANFHPVIHRIISRQLRSDGQFIFQVKGDAVGACDAPVRGAEVLGKACKIEDMNTVIGIKHIDMESPFWKNINYLLATINLAESRILFMRSKFAGLLRSLTRNMKTWFIDVFIR
jgi:signal peptidase I